MATLQDLYDDIKELIHQKFETKTEEDTTLPQIVESCFNYNQGELDIGLRMKLTVTGSSFETFSSTPFTYNGLIFVDWGDDSGLVEYTGGKLSHSFTNENSNHTIKVYGGITSIKGSCFHSCSGLTSINIPNGVSSIGSGCFWSCTSLTSIIIPNGVTKLANACFNRCIRLTSITIPDSVSSIGNNCFYKCTGLTSIHLNWNSSTNIPTYNSGWITDTSDSLKFIIPQGTTQLYIDKGYPSDKLVERD